MAFLALLLCSQFSAKGQRTAAVSPQALKNRFVHIPDSVQTSVYWYWISDNISKDGVVKDLQAMKKVGINRAFIGNIGLDNVPYGKIKTFSDEWWDILHTALQTAARLHIQIGIFNSAGWSQSGGPWIKPGQSMRYLASSQLMVKGPLLLSRQLKTPGTNFQDVKVIAYPVADGYNSEINIKSNHLSSAPVIDSLTNIADHNPSTSISLKGTQQVVVNIKLNRADTVRSVTIYTINKEAKLEGDIQAWKDDGYVTLRHFSIDRTNANINVGFIPFGPATISVPATATDRFRIVFFNHSENAGISEITLSATPKVESYLEKTLAKMWPTPHPFWEAYQWLPQPEISSVYAINPQKVIDISEYMTADGTLNWKIPQGRWIIERWGMAPTTMTNSPAPPEARGLEVDKMSQKHAREHFDAFIGQVLKRIPAKDRATFKVMVEDSYETGSQNWTDELIPVFKKTFGYDPVPYLPVLQGRVVGNPDISDRFLWDLRRLIADQVAYQYVGGLTKISHEHGLTTWLENYGHWGFPGEFLQYGGQADEVSGEFWSEGDLGDIENRAASSAAHIYGKNKVSAESFTAAGSPFQRYPANFKQRGDRFFTEGINNSLLHVYVHQPQDTIAPGMTAWFGVEFNRNNTWFNDIDLLLQYLKRCNLMLQQGHYAADVAYFIGEDAPKMTGVTNPPLPQGYSFDYINAEVIKSRLKVKDGKLVLPNGISYSLLVLPQLQTMRPELLIKLKELVQQGAHILGPKPQRSPSLAGYPAADRQVAQIADELWGAAGTKTTVNTYGKGSVMMGLPLEQALQHLQIIPDLKITKSNSVLFLHRVLNGQDIYFLSNQNNAPVEIDAAFRMTGKSPELWNAIDGSTRDLLHYSDNGRTTTIPLKFEPYESAFVVFKKNNFAKGSQRSNYPTVNKNIEITQPWLVSFDTKMRGPAKPVVFNTLTDWSKNLNDSIKFYSGVAHYYNTFTIDRLLKGSQYVIDLGVIKAFGKVTVNGKTIGGAWTPPYQVDITRALKPGVNRLDIKVVNTWVNRLIGDERLPASERKTSALFKPNADGELQPAGLLGPVTVKELTFK
jgi:hypothetical protein